MKAAIELSLYPLREDYELYVVDFIHRLREHEQIEIVTNNMSTQLVGEYDHLMSILTHEIKRSFQKEGGTVVVMKILNLAVSLEPLKI